ncbi:unnamed protein product [Amoebophrya sp. A120]|nr:unnamed protein product [Amoebophrya sp. A120]|eukprot:GSA120T00008394001.1
MTYIVPVTVSSPDSICFAVATPGATDGSGGGVTVADVCIKVIPVSTQVAGNDLIVRTAVVLRVCVPILLDDCRQLPITTIVKTIPNGAVAPPRRRMSDEAADLLLEDVADETNSNSLRLHRQLQQSPQPPVYSLEPAEPTLGDALAADEEPAIKDDKFFIGVSPAALLFFLYVAVAGGLATVVLYLYGKFGVERYERLPEEMHEIDDGQSEDLSLGGSVKKQGSVMQTIRKSVFGKMRNESHLAPPETGIELAKKTHTLDPKSFDFEAPEFPHWGVRKLGKNIPKNPALYFCAFFAYNLHFLRWFAVKAGTMRIHQLPYLGDEIAYFRTVNQKHMPSPVVKKFLVWRRSVLMFFCGIVAYQLVGTAVIEIAGVAENLIESTAFKQESRDHTEVRDGMGMMNNIDVSVSNEAEATPESRLLLEHIERTENNKQNSRQASFHHNKKHKFAHSFLKLAERKDKLISRQMQPLHERKSIFANTLDMFVTRKEKNSFLPASTSTSFGQSAARALQQVNATSMSEVDTVARRAAAQLADAMLVAERVKSFSSIMAIRNFVTTLVQLLFAVKALSIWFDYSPSSTLVIYGFLVKIAFITCLSYFPWFDIMFPEGNELCTSSPEFCDRILLPARLYMDLILNIPVITFAMSLIPGIAGGTMSVTEVLPFTIFPYFVMLCAPFLVVVLTLWPMLSIIAHGLGSVYMMLGALFYVAYALVLSYGAFKGMHTMTAFEDLGSEIYSRTNESKLEQLQHMAIQHYTPKKSVFGKVLSAVSKNKSTNASPKMSPAAPSGGRENQVVVCGGEMIQKCNTTHTTHSEALRTYNGRVDHRCTEKNYDSTLLQDEEDNKITKTRSEEEIGDLEMSEHQAVAVLEDVNPVVVFNNGSTGDGQQEQQPQDYSAQENHTFEDAEQSNAEEMHSLDHQSFVEGQHSKMNQNSAADDDSEDAEQKNNKPLSVRVVGLAPASPERETSQLSIQQNVTEDSGGIMQSTFIKSSEKLRKKMSHYSGMIESRLKNNRTGGLLVGSTFLGGVDDMTNKANGTAGGGVNENKPNVEYALVQATLIKHLCTNVKKKMMNVMRLSLLMQILALGFIAAAIIIEGKEFIDLAINSDMVASIMLLFADAMINKTMMDLITIDFQFGALVKMRLYNGYMSDDQDLSNLAVLFKFSDALNEHFCKGILRAQAKEQQKRSGDKNETDGNSATTKNPTSVGAKGSSAAKNLFTAPVSFVANKMVSGVSPRSKKECVD